MNAQNRYQNEKFNKKEFIKGLAFMAILLSLIYLSMFCQGAELDITTAGQIQAPLCAGPCYEVHQ